jgi:hypothetical protein
VASLQLVAVALFQSRDFAHWRDIYFGFSLLGRTSGSGYADYWLLPPAFYWSLLVHALTLLLPLVAIGLDAAVRRLDEPAPRALLIWVAGTLVLSAFAVKSGAYAFVIVPGWVALAALGAHALARGHRPSWVLLGLVFLAASPPVAALREESTVPIPVPLWLGVWAAAGLALVVARRATQGARAAAVALVVLAAAGGLYRESQRLPVRYHVPGYRAVVAALGPRLAPVAPNRLCLVTPEAPALGYYLFRTARYWGTPVHPWRAEEGAALAADSALRAFVVDPAGKLYGGWPDSSALGAVELSTREITSEVAALAGPGFRLRVFVRDR